MRKGTFFELGSAQRCQHLGRKNAIFVGKGYVFYKFYKRLQNKRVCVLISYIGKGYFLTGHSEKGYQFRNEMSNTPFRVSFVVLCSRIGTWLTSKRPPPPPPPRSKKSCQSEKPYATRYL